MIEPIGPHGYACLGELLRDAVIQFRSETAVIEVNRREEAERLTFAEFGARARALAAGLQARGLRPGDRVAILMTNQHRWLLTAWAALHAGAVLVPLDHKLEPTEQAALIRHAAPRVLVSEYPIWRRLAAPAAGMVVVSEVPAAVDPLGAVRWEVVPAPGEPRFEPRDRSDPACIVYSSGTGGRPKGCVLSHGAYLAQLEALLACFPMRPGDRFFSILPTNHAIDFMCGFVGPMACGATVVHQRTLRPELLMWTMTAHHPTHLAVVPAILAAFDRAVTERLDALPAWQRSALDAAIAVNAGLTERRPLPALSSRLLAPVHAAFGGALRLVFCGGAPTSREVAERFYRLGIPVVVGYGLTEACTVATVNGLTPFRADSVGRPVPGVEVRIADPDAQGVGEVLVGGPTLMSGYLDDPELTAETLRDGWLHTGDLGWLDASGHLHLVGRTKNMIVTPGGKNVYPEDVEGALGGVPCEELAVFASQVLWPGGGLENGELVAVVRATDPEAARRALAEANLHLPAFKRLASMLLWQGAFPRTASMKVKRAELAELVRAAHDRDQAMVLEAPRPHPFPARTVDLPGRA